MNKKRTIIFLLLICLLIPTGCGVNNKVLDEFPKPTATAAPTSSPVVPTDSPALSLSKAANPVSLNVQEADFVPIMTNARIPEYTVANDLSNVANLAQFGEFTKEQKRLLADNHFLVMPTTKWQLFFILEQNEYTAIPSFITTDAVLQMYHIFYDSILRQTEESSFLPNITLLTKNMLSQLLMQYDKATDEKEKSVLEYCIAYFEVARQLFGESPVAQSIPDKSSVLVAAEMDLIKAADGMGLSPISESMVLYSAFTVRGHYTRSEELSRYFLGMMWYGTMPFALFDETGSVLEDSVLKGILATNALMSLEDKDGQFLWESVYTPTVFFVGDSDDITTFDYWNLMIEVYGNSFTVESLFNSEKIQQFAEKVRELRAPKIGNKENNSPEFRFMGQRYIPDSEIMQRLSEDVLRPFPSGLDVAAVLGSEKAEKYIEEYLNPQQSWVEYNNEFEKIKNEFDILPESTWRSNMYYGWLWVLKPLFEKIDSGFPQFMQNDAWLDKSLNTALASWSELRHDTVLYGKPSGAEMGGWDQTINPGYVEPNIPVYERLLWLTNYSKDSLSQRGFLTDSVREKMTGFENMLNFLITCSIKELNYEALTDDEYNKLTTMGGWLERLSATMATSDVVSRWWEIESDTDRNMALVTDVHNVKGAVAMEYLHEGIGTAAEIYVITPNPDGNLYLTRGAVFDYFEFVSDEKLTDEKWQGMLQNAQAPERWGWTKSFFDSSQTDRVIPFP